MKAGIDHNDHNRSNNRRNSMKKTVLKNTKQAEEGLATTKRLLKYTASYTASLDKLIAEFAKRPKFSSALEQAKFNGSLSYAHDLLVMASHTLGVEEALAAETTGRAKARVAEFLSKKAA